MVIKKRLVHQPSIDFSPVIVTTKRFFACLLMCATNSFMDIEPLYLCYMWQDIVIALVGLSFGFMLLPQLRDAIHGKSVNVYTAGLTTVGLYILAITFVTLNMWITAFAELFSGTIWLLLFLLSVRNKRKTIQTFPLFYKSLEKCPGNPRISILLQKLR